MEEFFPSEIARLILGYLEISKCSNSWKIFFEESSDLQEYSRLYKEGKIYTTTVNGKSLLDILTEYCALKRNYVKNPNKCNCKCTCNSELQKTIANKAANGYFTLSTEPVTDNNFASRHSNFPASTSVQGTQGKRYASTPYDSSIKRKKILQSQRVTNNFYNRLNTTCPEVIELDIEKNNPMPPKLLNKNRAISDTSYKTMHRAQDFENTLNDTVVVGENNYSEECDVNNYSNDKLDGTVKVEVIEEEIVIPECKIASVNRSESLDFVLPTVKNACEYTVNGIKNANSHVDNPKSSGNGKNYSESDLTNQADLVCQKPSPTILSCKSLVNECIVEYNEAAKIDEGNQIINSAEFGENELQIAYQNESIDNSQNSCNNIMNEIESSTRKETTSIIPISQLSNQPNSGNEITFSDTPVVLIPSFGANQLPSQDCLHYSVILNSDFNYMSGRNIKILPKLATSPIENGIQNENIPLVLQSIGVPGEPKKNICDNPTKNVGDMCILATTKPQAKKKKVCSSKLKTPKRKNTLK